MKDWRKSILTYLFFFPIHNKILKNLIILKIPFLTCHNYSYYLPIKNTIFPIKISHFFVYRNQFTNKIRCKLYNYLLSRLIFFFVFHLFSSHSSYVCMYGWVRQKKENKINYISPERKSFSITKNYMEKCFTFFYSSTQFLILLRTE